MAQRTTNYNLFKPELTDAADITKMNENWDAIDAELKELADLDIADHYVWEKVTTESTWKVVFGTKYQYNIFKSAYSNYTFGTGYAIGDDGTLTLTGQFKPSKTPVDANEAYWRGLVPFYWKTANGVIYRADSWNSSDSTAITVYGYEMRTELANAQTSFGYVSHKLDNAYPPAVPDGFEYIPLGKLGEKVQFKIVTGTYTPTGKQGSANPNSLTFDGVPLMVWIDVNRTKDNSNTSIDDGFLTPTGGFSSSGSNIYPLTCNLNGNTLSWYANGGNYGDRQLNYKYDSGIYCSYTYKALIAE